MKELSFVMQHCGAELPCGEWQAARFSECVQNAPDNLSYVELCPLLGAVVMAVLQLSPIATRYFVSVSGGCPLCVCARTFVVFLVAVSCCFCL